MLVVVVVSKFAIGAWVPVVLIPLIVLLLRSVKRHYDRVGAALAVGTDFKPRRHTHTVVVLVGQIHPGHARRPVLRQVARPRPAWSP